MKRTISALLLAAACAASLAACGKSSNVSTESAGAGATAAPAGSGVVLVKAGTVFDGKLDKEISSKTGHDGDTFTLTYTPGMFKNDPALSGAVIEGHIAGVTAAGVGKKPAMTIVFDDIKMSDGSTAPVNVTVQNMGAFDAKSHHWRTAGMVIAGAVAGHMAAHATGKQHGGLMGAVGGYALSQTMKTDIDVKPGTLLEVKFVTDATKSN